MEPVDQPNSSTVGRKEQEKQEEFIASTSFTGAREDYIFTKGATVGELRSASDSMQDSMPEQNSLLAALGTNHHDPGSHCRSLQTG
jgi:hypothetical protein